MAQTMSMQRSGTAVSRRRAEVAPASRPVARAFTVQRPAAAVARVSGASSRAAAIVPRATAAPASSSASAPAANQTWYALVCNSEFFFNDPQNESVAEQLRERVRFFKEQGRESDFYIVPDPVWLDKKFPEQAKLVKRPCVALVATDAQWITFMKLRLDRVLKFDLSGLSEAEVLAAGGTVPEKPMTGKWTAPYARYTPGWWNVFLPKH